MKYYLALFQKIKEIYKSQSSNPREVALICPSSRIYEEDDLKLLLPQFLLSGNKEGEALLKKQDISFQLNSIPSSDRFWDVNPNKTLFEVYKQILDGYQPENIEKDSTEEDSAQLLLYDSKKKPTKEKKDYDKYLKLLEKAIGEWDLHVSKYSGLQNDTEKEVWSERLTLLHAKKEKALADLEVLGNKKLIEEALDKINRLSDYDRFIDILSDAKISMESLEKTGIQSMGVYHDINFIPYDFMSNANGWTKLKLNVEELNKLFVTAKQENTSSHEDYFSIDYDEKFITGIELEFSIVSLMRSWFNISPLLSEFLKCDELSPISDGETISNRYLLPAYPKKLLLIKNLKINIDATIKPEQIENINQLVQFGPLLMKSQLFTNTTTNENFLKIVNNKNTLNSQNVNYYINKSSVNLIGSGALEPKPSNTPLSRTADVSTTDRPIVPIKRVNLVRPLEPKPILPSSSPDVPVPDRPVLSAADIGSIKRIGELRLNPFLIQPVHITALEKNLTKVVLNVSDSISKLPIYKCGVSIIGTNNVFFREVETATDGRISFSLPIGLYKIDFRKDGYNRNTNDLNIENTNTINKDFFLKRESVSYNSFFLLGVICEKLPKIPKQS